MKHLFFLLMVLTIGLHSLAQDFISSSELTSVFQIRKDSSKGTSFIISHEKKRYLVTAKHVLGNVANNQVANFTILQGSSWLPFKGTVFIHSNPSIDLAVIYQNDDTTSSSPIKIEMDNSFVLGDEGYFLGFPFGMNTKDNNNLHDGFPFPLVKKCVYSGIYFEDGLLIFLLDGNNNPGFSGGPVFFKDREKSSTRYYLLSVISAYVNQKNQMITPFGTFDYTENSGIIISYGAKHIKEILEQNGK